MSTNSRFAIAVHTLAVLGFLSKQGVKIVSSQLIARSVNTNPVVIRNLLRSLKKAGLVKSKEGKEGGVSLAKAPSKISLQDIYAAVEQNSVLSLNKKPEYKHCPVSCGIKKTLPIIFKEVDKAVSKTLRGKTLQSIINSFDLP